MYASLPTTWLIAGKMGQNNSHFDEKYELLDQGIDDTTHLSDEQLSDDFDVLGVMSTDLKPTTIATQNAEDDSIFAVDEEDKKLLARSNSEELQYRKNGDIRNYDSDISVETVSVQNETLMSMTVEIFLPFIVAGYGMVAAGVVLDIVQHWEVFLQVNELFILVPALLGLKGNLEMTLASRLSTQVIIALALFL